MSATGVAAASRNAHQDVVMVTVNELSANAKPYSYHVQLCVGLAGGVTKGSKNTRTWLPLPLWTAAAGAPPSQVASPPPWWDVASCSTSVHASERRLWHIERGHNADYVELPPWNGERRTIYFQLHKVKTPARREGASVETTPPPVKVYGDRVVLTSDVSEEVPTEFTLEFGDTAIVKGRIRRVSALELQTLCAAAPPTTDTAVGRYQMHSLAETASQLKAKADSSLKGSRVHRFLSEWSGALEIAGGQLSPLVEALPFGELIVKAAAGLFAAAMGRGAVLELGAEICGQTALVLRVLAQPLVREMIVADPSTHALLERLVELMEDTMYVLQEYSASGVAAQLWKASSCVGALQQHSDGMRAAFTLLHQLTSFRAQAMHGDNLHNLLNVVHATSILTSEGLSSHLLPQLLQRIEQSAEVIDAAILRAENNRVAAISELRVELCGSLGNMVAAAVRDQFAEWKEANRDEATRLLSDVVSCVEDIVTASRATTVAIMSATMRSLLDEAAAILAAPRGLELKKKRLMDATGEAWREALEEALRHSVAQVQAHTNQEIQAATVETSSQVGELADMLRSQAASARHEGEMLKQLLLDALGSQDGGLLIPAGAATDDASVIAVLHNELTGEQHMQRRVLRNVHSKLDELFEADGIERRNDAIVEAVLTALPETLCRVLAHDVQRLRQQLRCESRSKEVVKSLLNRAVGRLLNALKEHEALRHRQQRVTKRHMERLERLQRESLPWQFEEHDLRNQQHDEVTQLSRTILSTLDRMIATHPLLTVTTNSLVYDSREDSGDHLATEQRAYFSTYPLALLQAELRVRYYDLNSKETSVIAPAVQMERMDMYTSLRIVSAPQSACYRHDAADQYDPDGFEGTSMDSTEVLTIMAVRGWRSLLVEGRAGIGKTTWTTHLSLLQNYANGLVILLRLSEVAQYLKDKRVPSDGASLSARELLLISLGGDVNNYGELVTRIHYHLRCGTSHAVWLVDGLDEVLGDKNALLRTVLDSVKEAVSDTALAWGSRIFGQSDLVVVTSREERGGVLRNANLVATINPWTDVDAIAFIKNFFLQDDVRAAISRRATIPQRDALISCIERVTTAIETQRFGSLSTLPIVLEMLCWCTAGQTTDILDICTLYRDTINSKLRLARTKLWDPPWAASDDEIVELCQQQCITTESSGFFEIDCQCAGKASIGLDLLRSGLVREQFGAHQSKTIVRFVDKSFLQYFQASYFSKQPERLREIKVDYPLSQQTIDHGMSFIVFSTDVIRIETQDDAAIDLSLERAGDCKSVIEIFWLDHGDQKADLKSGILRNALLKWDAQKTPSTNVPVPRLMRGRVCFFVLRSPEVCALRCHIFGRIRSPPQGSQLLVTREMPLIDILEHRGFFQFLGGMVRGHDNQHLTRHLMDRLRYYVIRQSSANPSLETAVSNVIECLAQVLPSHKDVGLMLTAAENGTSVVPQSLRIKQTSVLCERALRPCAMYGSLIMWHSLEERISADRKAAIARDGATLQEALCLAVRHRRVEIASELENRGVAISLVHSSRFGLTEVARRVIMEICNSADTSIDHHFAAAFAESLGAAQLETAKMLWTRFVTIEREYATPTTWKLLCCSACRSSNQLPAEAAAWLAYCITDEFVRHENVRQLLPIFYDTVIEHKQLREPHTLRLSKVRALLLAICKHAATSDEVNFVCVMLLAFVTGPSPALLSEDLRAAFIDMAAVEMPRATTDAIAKGLSGLVCQLDRETRTSLVTSVASHDAFAKMALRARSADVVDSISVALCNIECGVMFDSPEIRDACVAMSSYATTKEAIGSLSNAICVGGAHSTVLFSASQLRDLFQRMSACVTETDAFISLCRAIKSALVRWSSHQPNLNVVLVDTIFTHPRCGEAVDAVLEVFGDLLHSLSVKAMLRAWMDKLVNSRSVPTNNCNVAWKLLQRQGTLERATVYCRVLFLTHLFRCPLPDDASNPAVAALEELIGETLLNSRNIRSFLQDVCDDAAVRDAQSVVLWTQRRGDAYVVSADVCKLEFYGHSWEHVLPLWQFVYRRMGNSRDLFLQRHSVEGCFLIGIEEVATQSRGIVNGQQVVFAWQGISTVDGARSLAPLRSTAPLLIDAMHAAQSAQPDLDGLSSVALYAITVTTDLLTDSITAGIPTIEGQSNERCKCVDREVVVGTEDCCMPLAILYFSATPTST